MKVQLASLEKPRYTFTSHRQEIHSDLKETISAIARGKERDSLSVIGVYGSEEMQLQYKAFDIAGEREGKPALHTDPDSILKGFRGSNSSISDWLSKRVQEQINVLNDDKNVAWLSDLLPESRIEDRLSTVVQQVLIADDATRILLVDEGEQVYGSSQDQTGTDGENILRVLLDEVQGVYQSWNSGLISVYELPDEAVLRRFRGFGVAVRTPDDVHRVLQREGKPEALTNGIGASHDPQRSH